MSQPLRKMALAALLLAAAARAEDWSPTFEALARQPGQERTAFEYLQRQPIEVKRTAAYHVALARAARAIDNQLWASRPLMVLTLFLEPSPAPDLTEVKRWLGEKGLEHHRRARESLAKGDIAATMLEVSGLKLVHDARPTWWEWKAEYRSPAAELEIGITLLGSDSGADVWGGSTLSGACDPRALLDLWSALRRSFPGVWLHDPECNIYTPDSFRERFMKLSITHNS